MSERLNIPDRELLAAIGTMLATWDDATAKMVVFMQDQNTETAKAYSECMPRMFDAACLAREVYSRFRGKGDFAQVVTRQNIADRLRILSGDMGRLAGDMEYSGGFGEIAAHGRELLGAAHIARGWAEGIEAETQEGVKA